MEFLDLQSLDLGLQLDLALRLLAAAVLGAVIGFEREIHDHPAGMRTHLLVSLGSALFTVLSIYAFTDPSAAFGTRYRSTRHASPPRS